MPTDELVLTAEMAVAKPDHAARGHSPLGASGAERWMKCPGSVALLKRLDLPESDEPDYRREGTAMHEAAAHALEHDYDAWELVGDTFNATPMTAALANPIQSYLDLCRRIAARADSTFIEYAISSPVHPLFYGMCDFGAVATDGIDVVDLKGGEGIMVEVFENPQLKYYAFGIIDGLERTGGFTFPDETPVRLWICQPRGFHADGPTRCWVTTVGALKAWINSVLVPAMLNTEWDDRLDAGAHCRFCPAKLVCPLMVALFGAACTANPKHVVQLTDEAIGLNYRAAAAAKFYIKALETEALERQMKGRVIAGLKLVKKKANRVWKDGAIGLAKAKFGGDAMTTPELKSPPQLAAVSPAAAEWVKEFAYTPDTGLTVALEEDAGVAVPVKTAAQVFGSAVDNLTPPA